jgi:hypothetical protein
MKELVYIISEGSCNGEEKQFAEWVRKNNKNITEVKIENTLSTGYFSNDYTEQELTEMNEWDRLWDEYCSS